MHSGLKIVTTYRLQKELWVINLDLKIDVGRLATVSLTQSISHGGIPVQERVKKLFWRGVFPFGRFVGRWVLGMPCPLPGASALSVGREEGTLGAAPGSALQTNAWEQAAFFLLREGRCQLPQQTNSGLILETVLFYPDPQGKILVAQGNFSTSVKSMIPHWS